jgi:hypothetical protein
MSEQKKWDYRIVRSNKEDGTPADWYSIQEVYYDDETGKPSAQSIDLQVEGENKDEMRKQLQDMLSAFDRDTISEIKSEVNNKDTKYDTLDGYNPASDTSVTLGSDGRGNTIFESPDGGDTIYRRMMGETDRTIIKGSNDLPGDHGLEIRTQEEVTMKQRLLNLEIENSDLKDMLREKGVDIA